MIATVKCEICLEDSIAKIKTDAFFFPMTGEQFLSPDTLHDFPPPFPPAATWEDMRCPYCRLRPFTSEDYVSTDIGLIYAKTPEPEPVIEKVELSEEEKAKPFKCPYCDHRSKAQHHLNLHVKFSHKDKV